MPTVEITLPEELYTEFERVVEDEFVTREKAVEELLGAGIDAYTREFDDGEPDFAEEFAEDMWDTAEDPARTEDEGEGEEYTF